MKSCLRNNWLENVAQIDSEKALTANKLELKVESLDTRRGVLGMPDARLVDLLDRLLVEKVNNATPGAAALILANPLFGGAFEVNTALGLRNRRSTCRLGRRLLLR